MNRCKSARFKVNRKGLNHLSKFYKKELIENQDKNNVKNIDNSNNYDLNNDNSIYIQKESNTREYIISLFSKPLFGELFFAWSRDCENEITVENAKYFREELIMRGNKDNKNFNFRSLRVSKNFLVAFCGNLNSNSINKLDFSDNLLTDISLHNIKSLIANRKIVHLNLASNMISTEGLKIIHNEIINSESLLYLNLGILETSFRRNNFSGDGGLIIAKILLTNQSINTLILQDNELGDAAGEKIGSSLIQNKTLKKLKISENKIKNIGAKSILDNAENLTTLDLSNNEISSEICFDLKKLLINSKLLEELIWDSNDIGLKGIKLIIEGNTGIKLIAEGIANNTSIEELDISSNSVSLEGFIPLCDCLLTNNIKTFKCTNNLLGDDSMKYFASTVLKASNKYTQNVSNSTTQKFNNTTKQSYNEKIQLFKNTIDNPIKLRSIDFSSSKIYDQGLIYLLDKLQDNKTIKSIKLKDNYFTHEVDMLLVKYLSKNTMLTAFNIEKNRLSLLCKKKVHDLILRNISIEKNKESNRLLVEVYRLRYENTKLDEMKDTLKNIENNIEKVKLNKNDIRQEFDTYKRNSQEEYEKVQKKIKLAKDNLKSMKNEINNLTTKKNNIRQEYISRKEKLEKEKNFLLEKKQKLIELIDIEKEQFAKDEENLNDEYDKLRNEKNQYLESIKYYKDTEEIFNKLNEAEKKLKYYKDKGYYIEDLKN